MSYSPGFPSFLSGMAGAGAATGNGQPMGWGQTGNAGQPVGAGGAGGQFGSVLAPYVSQIGQLFNNPNVFGQGQQQQPQMPPGPLPPAGWANQGQGQSPSFQPGSLPPYLQSLWQMMQGWGQHQQGAPVGQGAYGGNAGFSAYDPFGPQFR